MTATSRGDSAVRLGADELEELLEVTRRLASPYDLNAMLAAVVDAARKVLHAERGSVFLYDATSNELVLKVATGLAPIRVPADRGIVGQCAQTRRLINVPDCYADPRFNPEVDRKSGYRTRCMLSLPLISHEDELIGVLQILNRHEGSFDKHDERVASALAAQCAVALHRVQMTETRLLTEKLDREIAVAREIQMSALPKEMPQVAGYDGAGLFRPTDQTGGDLFDFVRLPDGRLFLLLGDATGPRHRTGALRHPGSRDDPRRPATGCRARRGLYARQQPARRRPARRPFRHRVPGTARHHDAPRGASTPAARARCCTTARRPRRSTGTARPRFRWAHCRSPASSRRTAWCSSPATCWG